MTVLAFSGQTVFDIAIERYGSLSGLAFLLEDNSYDGKLIFGDIELESELVEIREDQVINQVVVDYHFNNHLVTY